MADKPLRQRPLLTLPQIIVALLILAGLIIAFDLNRRSRAGELVGVGETALREELDLQATRQVELQATRLYVESDDYIDRFAHDEANLLQPGETQVVVVEIPATPVPTAPPPPTPDPAQNAYPWQAWLRLLSDVPQPTR